jgi:hypothetical protein
LTSPPPDTNAPVETTDHTFSEATLEREVAIVMALLIGGILIGLLLGAQSQHAFLGCAGIPICIRMLRYHSADKQNGITIEQATAIRLPCICAIGALIVILSAGEVLPFILFPILLLVIGVGHFGKKGQRLRMLLILAIQWFATYLLIVAPSMLVP